MDFLEIAKNFGVPVALLAVLLAGAWWGGRFVASKILLPLIDDHREFLKAVAADVRKNLDCQTTIQTDLQGLRGDVKGMTQILVLGGHSKPAPVGVTEVKAS